MREVSLASPILSIAGKKQRVSNVRLAPHVGHKKWSGDLQLYSSVGGLEIVC